MPDPSNAGEPREQFRQEFENMLWNLFAPNRSPLFDKSEIPPALLDEFLQSDDAYAAAREFALKLRTIWMEKNPSIALRLTPLAAPRPSEVKAHVFPVLSPTAPATSAPATPPPTTPAAEPAAATLPSPEIALPTAPEENPEQPSRSAHIDLTRRPGAVPPAGTAHRKPVDRTASFQTANAKAGLAYTGSIERIGAVANVTRLRNVLLPEGLDLSFSEDDAALTGTPAVAGDHEITFEWSDDETSWYPGKCVLIVNPDPRSLWQVREPAADLPYRKPHLDSQLISVAGYNIAAASRRGRSHEHSGTFRDDDFFINHDPASGWEVIIVADGAGSAKNSRWGSRLATEAAGVHLVAALAGERGSDMNQVLDDWDATPDAGQNIGGKFFYLFKEAATLAVQAIEAEALAQDGSVKDYATTLLVCAIKRQGENTFLASFWMGDGAIAAYESGRVRLMGSPDGGEFAGQTRFLDRAALADHGFGKRIGIGRYPNLASVILMTDGISDPRFETDNGLADAKKWDALWDEIAPCLAAPTPDQALLAWLDFFTPGHHDDRTMAILW